MELEQLGLTVRSYNATADIGGTWYWNRYPGPRTDGEAWVYLLNFAPELMEEWEFHERYPTRDEIQQYLGRIVGQICRCPSYIRWLKGREAYLLT